MTQRDKEKPQKSTPVGEFNDAIALIASHNKDYSGGRGMANSIIGIMFANIPKEALSDDETESTTDVSFSDERDMAQDIMNLTTSPTLSNLGLELTEARTEMVVMTAKGNHDIGPVELRLQDGDKFGDFLLAAPHEQVDEQFSDNVKAVVGSINGEFYSSIVDGGNSDFIAETIATADKILSGLEHLGLKESPVVQRFKQYLEHVRKGDLAEFVLGLKYQLDRKPEDQQFGPSQWQGDATPQFLQDRWDQVITLLRKAKANPRAHDIFLELTQSAQESLAAAKQNWAEIKTKYQDRRYGEGFDGILNEVDARIQELKGS